VMCRQGVRLIDKTAGGPVFVLVKGGEVAGDGDCLCFRARHSLPLLARYDQRAFFSRRYRMKFSSKVQTGPLLWVYRLDMAHFRR
jgi:hypothetical protein